MYLVFALFLVLVRSDCDIYNEKDFKKRCKTASGTIRLMNDITVSKGSFVEWDLEDGTVVNFNNKKITYADPTSPVFDKRENVKFLFRIQGKKLRLSNLILNANGKKLWDGQGLKLPCNKPKTLKISTDDSTYTNFKIYNTPMHAVSVNGESNVINGWLIDNTAGTHDKAKNTDGFDMSGKSNTVKNSIIKSWDDCVAMNDGTGHKFINNECHGSHGLSISVKGGKKVKNAEISGNKVYDSKFGMRVKGRYNSYGVIDNITFKNNRLEKIYDNSYSILIAQDYTDDPDKTETGYISGPGVTIKNIKVEGTTFGTNGKRKCGVKCDGCSNVYRCNPY